MSTSKLLLRIINIFNFIPRIFRNSSISITYSHSVIIKNKNFICSLIIDSNLSPECIKKSVPNAFYTKHWHGQEDEIYFLNSILVFTGTSFTAVFHALFFCFAGTFTTVHANTISTFMSFNHF